MKNKEKFAKEILDIACSGDRYDAELDKVFAWADGKTSWTTVLTYDWKYAKLPESENRKDKNVL